MKRLYVFFIVLTLTVCLFAQTPQKMSYQAVIRNSTNQLVTNKTTGIKISILQGSASGTVVYSETQNPTTNANGLASIEIGSGTVVYGSFATIDWANGTYFIKTETDPTGGTSYSITGTSQLLSVPYALYAKTSGNGFSGNYNDLTNKPTTDGSETKVIAGTNVTVTGSGTDASPYVVNASGTSHSIGESYQGGIIFWLDATGQHGLIAATSDQSTSMQWYNSTNRYTGTTGDGLYAGNMNTAIIVAAQMTDNQIGNFAAKICADYSVTVDGVTYGDWYLPSKFELNLLYAQRALVGGFNNYAYYWSSTESNNTTAWYSYWGNGNQNVNNKTGTSFVRAIRAF